MTIVASKFNRFLSLSLSPSSLSLTLRVPGEVLLGTVSMILDTGLSLKTHVLLSYSTVRTHTVSLEDFITFAGLCVSK